MRPATTPLTRPITPDEVNTFWNCGVVLLRGVFDLRSVNGLRREIDMAVATLQTSQSGYDFTKLTSAYEARDQTTIAEHSGGQHDLVAIADYMRQSGQPLMYDAVGPGAKGSFLVDTGTTARIPGIRRFAVNGAAPEIAGALLGAEEVRLFGDQIFVKEPGTRERTTFHQDASYFDLEGNQCLTMWIPVDPVKAEVGGMLYVRGSHRDPTLYAPNVFVSRTRLPGSEGPDIPDIEGNLDRFDVVSFDVEPGDVIVHHYRTIHGARGNLSRYQVRRAFSVRYCGDDIRGKTRPGVPRLLHLTKPITDGEPLAGHPDFPVVWRKSPSERAA